MKMIGIRSAETVCVLASTLLFGGGGDDVEVVVDVEADGVGIRSFDVVVVVGGGGKVVTVVDDDEVVVLVAS